MAGYLTYNLKNKNLKNSFKGVQLTNVQVHWRILGGIICFFVPLNTTPLEITENK